jgi:hypothetical protein
MIKFKLSLPIFFLLSLFILTKNEIRYLYFGYPSLLTLNDQSKVIVGSDGIHFYDSNLEVEDKTKNITFENKIDDRNKNDKTVLTQFSSEDEGYILILVMDILYIFESNGSIIDIITLPNTISSKNYYINPYKVEDNNLHFIISYTNSTTTFSLNYFIFNKVNKNLENNEKIMTVKTNEGGNVDSVSGVTCLFLNNPDYGEILTCFYSTNYYSEIQTRSFNCNNNLEEYSNLYINYTDRSVINGLAAYISAITDKKKEKAIIYIVFNGVSYWMTFDFKNHFSFPSIMNKPSQYSILGINSFHKLYFFEELEEFIF